MVVAGGTLTTIREKLMIGRTTRAFGADDVALPNDVQKTTFSDDR